MSKGSDKDSNSLSKLLAAPSGSELVGPTLEDDIRRVINRYGAAAVREAVAKLTKPRRGRPKISDMRELQPVMQKDAREWLEGGDPFSTRTNYAIAKEYADSRPGHSAVSTCQRIERKLGKKPFDRRWYMLVTAMEITRAEYPYALHIRALEELAAVENSHPVWRDMLSSALLDIADFGSKLGKPPRNEMTMAEVQSGARNSPVASAPSGKVQGHIAALLSVDSRAEG